MLVSEGLELARPRSSRRQPQPQQSDPLKCPRCESTNTKFCYYNNYNKTQPRYYCKACKRHWTKGGTLRNVPVGGGRKHRRFNLPNITATAATTNMGSMVIRNKHSIDQRGLLGLSDPQDTSDAAKALFFKPTGSERRDDVESYTDIEELKGLASWDIYGSFTGCTMQQLPHEDHQRLGFSKLSSSFETNHGSNTPRSCIDKLENVEGSTTTTTSMMIMPSSQQWQVASTSNILEPNYRSWNDLDTMVLEDLNKPWEDPQFQT